MLSVWQNSDEGWEVHADGRSVDGPLHVQPLSTDPAPCFIYHSSCRYRRPAELSLPQSCERPTSKVIPAIRCRVGCGAWPSGESDFGRSCLWVCAADGDEPPTSEALGAHAEPMELIQRGFHPARSCGLGQNLYVEPSGDSFPCYAYHRPHAYLGNVMEEGLKPVLEMPVLMTSQSTTSTRIPSAIPATCDTCAVVRAAPRGGGLTQLNLDNTPPDCGGLAHRAGASDRCSGIPRNQIAFGDPVVFKLLKFLWFSHDLKCIDGLARRDSAVALGQLGDPRAVEPLVKALGDDDRYVRIAVATALGQLGDPRAVEPLVKALGDDNIDVRIAVATALGNWRSACG